VHHTTHITRWSADSQILDTEGSENDIAAGSAHDLIKQQNQAREISLQVMHAIWNNSKFKYAKGKDSLSLKYVQIDSRWKPRHMLAILLIYDIYIKSTSTVVIMTIPARAKWNELASSCYNTSNS
jgi:hypothetical protein